MLPFEPNQKPLQKGQCKTEAKVKKNIWAECTPDLQRMQAELNFTTLSLSLIGMYIFILVITLIRKTLACSYSLLNLFASALRHLYKFLIENIKWLRSKGCTYDHSCEPKFLGFHKMSLVFPSPLPRSSTFALERYGWMLPPFFHSFLGGKPGGGPLPSFTSPWLAPQLPPKLVKKKSQKSIQHVTTWDQGSRSTVVSFFHLHIFLFTANQILSMCTSTLGFLWVLWLGFEVLGFGLEAGRRSLLFDS